MVLQGGGEGAKMTQIAAKWNEAGRYLSQVQLVHTLMRQVFEGHEVGPEILPWMISEGQRDFFLKMDELSIKSLWLWLQEVTKVI